VLVPGNTEPWPKARDKLNALLRGWSAYFCYGTRLMAYRAVDNHVYHAVRPFLRRRHKVQSRGTRSFPAQDIFGTRGILSMRRVFYGPLPSEPPAWDPIPDDMR
jgi:RNA-directed DNA polymerase